MRRTKIICTIGPRSSAPEVIRELMLAGMDVARLNFSHGDHAFHRQTFTSVRRIARELGRNVAIMMDLQGPKIRTGPLQDDKSVELVNGASICLTTRRVPGDKSCVSTTYANLPNDVHVGDALLLADGTLELRVDRVSAPDVHCTVIRGGALGSHKGINLPGVKVSAPSLTEKDLEDLDFGLELGTDYVALSFVRSAADIRQVKAKITDRGFKTAVVAKIERPEALAVFDEIIEVTDAVMVARGDLGVEVPLQDVPQIQKDLIRKCNDRGIPVITATQMLESMIFNSRPTRAETADVANAIYDGTDAVMLSGETASGLYPVEAARTMAMIARSTDRAIAQSPPRDTMIRLRDSHAQRGSFSDAIGQAVCRMAYTLDLKRIVCFTKSGHTAMSVARYRPNIPITAISLNDDALRRCALVWGIDTVQTVEISNVDELIAEVDELLMHYKLAKEGDTVVLVAGIPMAVKGRTNMLKLHVVGEVI